MLHRVEVLLQLGDQRGLSLDLKASTLFVHGLADLGRIAAVGLLALILEGGGAVHGAGRSRRAPLAAWSVSRSNAARQPARRIPRQAVPSQAAALARGGCRRAYRRRGCKILQAADGLSVVGSAGRPKTPDRAPPSTVVRVGVAGGL